MTSDWHIAKLNDNTMNPAFRCDVCVKDQKISPNQKEHPFFLSQQDRINLFINPASI